MSCFLESNCNELANLEAESDNFDQLIHHKLSQNGVYWSYLGGPSTNMIANNVRLSFTKDFFIFWLFSFGVGLWVCVCILVKGFVTLAMIVQRLEITFDMKSILPWIKL